MSLHPPSVYLVRKCNEVCSVQHISTWCRLQVQIDLPEVTIKVVLANRLSLPITPEEMTATRQLVRKIIKQNASTGNATVVKVFLLKISA